MSKKFKNGYFSLIENIPFHDTFGNKRRKNFTAYLLNTLLRLPKNTIASNNIKVWSEKILEKFSYDDKEMRCDVVITYNGIIYNLEAFTEFKKEGVKKVIFYGDKTNSSQVEIGDSYNDKNKVVQVVIVRNASTKLNKKLITNNMLSENNVILSDIRKIIVFRLDLLDDIKYNEGESDKRLLQLLKFLKAKNQKERDHIVEGNEDLMKINEFVKRFMKNKKAEEKYHKYNFQQRIWEEIGHDRGRDEGIAIGNKKFAKYLESNGKTIEEISNTMELPMNEIKELLKS